MSRVKPQNFSSDIRFSSRKPACNGESQWLSIQKFVSMNIGYLKRRGRAPPTLNSCRIWTEASLVVFTRIRDRKAAAIRPLTMDKNGPASHENRARPMLNGQTTDNTTNGLWPTHRTISSPHDSWRPFRSGKRISLSSAEPPPSSLYNPPTIIMSL